MSDNELRITKRHLPHWSLQNATYFVTFRLDHGTMTTQEQIIVRDHIVEGHSQFYTLIAVQVMPDHCHVIFMADTGYDLEKIMKGIKGVSARKVNDSRSSKGRLWQTESFDRIMRNEKELNGKLLYMLNNPLEAGLAEDRWNYPGWFCNEEFFRRW
jgi:REP element-mobilizing transposase RayT